MSIYFVLRPFIDYPYKLVGDFVQQTFIQNVLAMTL